MTEVTDIAGSVELKGDADTSFGDAALDFAKQTPVAKQAIKGYETVTNIWQGLPEDPDVADIMLHAGDVVTDAAGFTAECAMEAGMAVKLAVSVMTSPACNMMSATSGSSGSPCQMLVTVS